MAESASIVITCFREGRLLLEAVASARAQPTDEIVIVNDASTDPATNRVCDELQAAGDVRVIRLAQNGGPAAARNAGFAAARGEILIPLDADDCLPEGAVRSIVAAFSRHVDAGFIYGSHLRQDNPQSRRLVQAQSMTLASLLKARPLSWSTNWRLLGTAPLRRWLWQRIGGGDETMGTADLHDVDFWIRAMALPCAAYAIPDVIYIWRKYLGQNSRQVTLGAWARIAHKHREVYRAQGLDYRACELLLLDAKWRDDRLATARYDRELRDLLARGQGELTTLVSLLMPAALVRVGVRGAARRR